MGIDHGPATHTSAAITAMNVMLRTVKNLLDLTAVLPFCANVSFIVYFLLFFGLQLSLVNYITGL